MMSLMLKLNIYKEMMKREHDGQYMEIVNRRKLSSKKFDKQLDLSASKRVSLPGNPVLNLAIKEVNEDSEPDDFLKNYNFPQDKNLVFKKENKF